MKKTHDKHTYILLHDSRLSIRSPCRPPPPFPRKICEVNTPQPSGGTQLVRQRRTRWVLGVRRCGLGHNEILRTIHRDRTKWAGHEQPGRSDATALTPIFRSRLGSSPESAAGVSPSRVVGVRLGGALPGGAGCRDFLERLHLQRPARQRLYSSSSQLPPYLVVCLYLSALDLSFLLGLLLRLARVRVCVCDKGKKEEA